MNVRLPLALALIVLLAGPLPGQYFGRNKVRYATFDFKILKTEHFDIYFYPAEEQAAGRAALMLERWHNRFAEVFGIGLQHQPVVIYASHGHFEQTNVIGGLIDQSVGGLTEPLDNRIVVALTGVDAEDDHVLGHELVHAFQFAVIAELEKRGPAYGAVPTWFMEGMAEYLSVGERDGQTAMWLRDALLSGPPPSLAQIGRNEQRYFPYRFGHAIWAYLAGVRGDSIVAPLFASVLRNGWSLGFLKALDTSFDTLSLGWQQAVQEHFGPQLQDRDTGAAIGVPLVRGEGGLNLCPVVSPDGRQVAFMALRDVFTVDLFVLDTRRGKLSKLASANRDEHFESISFVNTAGAWAPDGRRFAMSVFDKGRNAIAIFDVGRRRLRRTIAIPQLEAIAQLAWSPDGTALALAGTSAGRGGLYLYTLADGELRRLTEEGYTAIQPAFSPDGGQIAFATNRGPATDLDSLRFGPLAIGLLDVASGEIDLLAISPHTRHICPQYSPDGSSLFFVADPDGFSDLYRYDLYEQRFFRLSTVASGVAGLTELSPCLSVAARAGRVVFNVFEKGQYNIYALADTATGGTSCGAACTADFERVTSLPPLSNRELIPAYLASSATGISDTVSFGIRPYRPRLKLNYIGQLYAGLAADAFGLGIAGGAFFLFSDMLGDHLLGSGIQLNGGLLDLGGQVEYLNLTRRFNWGASVSHIPYLTSSVGFGADSARIDSQTVAVNTATILNQRLFEDKINLIGQYPLSTNRRFEMSAGYAHYGFTNEQQLIATTVDGRTVQQTTTYPDAPGGLHLVNFALAYVGDFSLDGFTGPLGGRRFRLELAPTTGSLTFLNLTADYRHYRFIRPLTLALRGLHVGRYLKDSGDERLSVYFVGYPTLVRGYDAASFDLSGDCEDSTSGDCGQFNRLIGTRMAVFNAELRLPLLGTQRLGLIDFKYLPTDLVAFFDGGLAWTKDDPPSLSLDAQSGERIPVFSTGLGLRFNLFGAFILQLYYVYPFQRPGKAPYFGIVFAPGW